MVCWTDDPYAMEPNAPMELTGLCSIVIMLILC